MVALETLAEMKARKARTTTSGLDSHSAIALTKNY